MSYLIQKGISNRVNIIKYSLIFIFFMLFIMFNAVSILAEKIVDNNEKSKISDSTQHPQLQAQLYSSQTHALLGEPLMLTFALKNIGTKTASILRCAPPGSDYLNYEIVAPGKQPITFKTGGVIYGTSKQKISFLLQPSDIYSRTDNVTNESKGMLLNKVGEYVIHAIYSLPDGVEGGPLTIRSNGVCIVVEEPTGIDKNVYDELTDHIAKKYSNGRFWSLDEDCISEYETIINKYPKSRYNDYISFYLAQAIECMGTISTNNKTDKEITSYIEKAKVNYENVADSLGDSPLGIYSKQLAGGCYATLGKPDIAEQKFRTAFCSKSVTSEGQIKLLVSINNLYPNRFYNESRLTKKEENIVEKRIMLPLLPYAYALGYNLEKNDKTEESLLIKGNYKWIIKIGENPLPVCGTLYKNMKISIDKDGEYIVSPSVIAMLMAERYGKDIAKILWTMLIENN